MSRAPTTAGNSSSRLTIAACEVRLPWSVTIAAALVMTGSQPGLVASVTNIAPPSNRPISSAAARGAQPPRGHRIPDCEASGQVPAALPQPACVPARSPDVLGRCGVRRCGRRWLTRCPWAGRSAPRSRQPTEASRTISSSPMTQAVCSWAVVSTCPVRASSVPL